MENFFNGKIEEELAKKHRQFLRQYFDSKIKQNFLIEMLSKIKEEVKRKDIDSLNYIGEYNDIDFEICRMIVGAHKANTIFMEEHNRTALEKDDKYKKELIKIIIEEISIREYASVSFKKYQLLSGDEFLFFPVPYMLYAISRRSLDVIDKNKNNDKISELYFKVFYKALSVLTLLENNLLVDACIICRSIIEIFIKILIIEDMPEAKEKFKLLNKYEYEKTCCGKDYPDEFNKMVNERKNKKQKKMLDYLHYGWVDVIDDYHSIVKVNPYSLNGLLIYLDNKYKNTEGYFDYIKTTYKMFSSYTHSTVGFSKYQLLHYFEISIALYITVVGTYNLMFENLDIDSTINGVDVIKSLSSAYELLIKQYELRTTENFENYYKPKH